MSQILKSLKHNHRFKTEFFVIARHICNSFRPNLVSFTIVHLKQLAEVVFDFSFKKDQLQKSRNVPQNASVMQFFFQSFCRLEAFFGKVYPVCENVGGKSPISKDEIVEIDVQSKWLSSNVNTCS